MSGTASSTRSASTSSGRNLRTRRTNARRSQARPRAGISAASWSPLGRQAAGDDEDNPDKASGRRAFFPSSMGLSVLVPASTQTLEAEITWGDYDTERPKDEEVTAGVSGP